MQYVCIVYTVCKYSVITDLSAIYLQVVNSWQHICQIVYEYLHLIYMEVKYYFMVYLTRTNVFYMKHHVSYSLYV
jgi:hypothetical protein